jgi:hypothetical protein
MTAKFTLIVVATVVVGWSHQAKATYTEGTCPQCACYTNECVLIHGGACTTNDGIIVHPPKVCEKKGKEAPAAPTRKP